MKNDKQHIRISTKSLSIGFLQKKEQIIIAKDINISIKKGKFIGLLGKNGIGKSTLLRTLSKVQNPLNGEIKINEKNIENFTNKELAKNLSLVLTERLPESQLTVYELIALGRQPYTNWLDKISKSDQVKIEWAIEQTTITHLINKKVHELSDGQLQRVLIARALAQDTEVIILDEPTAHLDMHHTYKIFQLLKKLVETTSKTIIVSTHQINLAIEIVDELIIMKPNELVHNSTQKIIKSDVLDDLFPKEILNFNKRLQQFTIRKNN